jgi:hypothetical protein
MASVTISVVDPDPIPIDFGHLDPDPRGQNQCCTSGMCFPDPDLDFLPIPDSARGQQGTCLIW